MDDQTSASLPTNPGKAATTGSDSIRHQRLVEIFQRSMQATTGALTFEKLAQCYPYVAENGSAGLREALNQAMRFWDSSSSREFYAILEERDVASKLSELDQLVLEARDRKQRADDNVEDADSGYGRQVYVESLTPEDIVKAHLGPTNLKETESLEGRIRAVQSANKQLLKTVESQEKEISELFSTISKSLNDLQKASDETDGLPDQAELFISLDELNELANR
ncbi:Nnf1-domain-containing protein [Kockiozyma suomiensis]|uniref:Nnf1-domain-containing protein n=1 Tax=Kockiozyma suomiensis TaxID=1337062 RepID=UPI0033440DD9